MTSVTQIEASVLLMKLTGDTLAVRSWPAFEQALAEFNRKYRVDWTSRELQPSTAEAIAERAYEIEITESSSRPHRINS